MKKLISLVLALVLSLSLIACGAKQDDTPQTAEKQKLIVGFDAEFPPFGFIAADGSYDGFDLAMAEELCSRLGWDFEAVPIVWDSKDAELAAGTINCIWNGFTYTGRENDYTWSDPYVDNSIVMVVKADSGISSLADLAGKSVMAQAASSAVDGGFRFLSLYPTDIDGSGVIEIPEPIPFPPLDEESETYYRILWRDYDSAGKSEVVCRTFHNAADGWSLLLPETWDERVSLLRAGTPDENAVLFFCRSSDGQLQPFLEICALTGSAREEHARRGDRFVLARQVETVYTAELLPCDDWDGAVDEETVKKSFSLIVAEWTTGEN